MNKRKKTVALFLTTIMLLTLTPLSCFKASALFASNSFNSATSSSDPGQYVANIALAQSNRTGSSLGYSDQWCAFFVSDCASIAGQSAAVPANGNVLSLYNAIISAGGTLIYSGRDGTGSLSNSRIGDICIIDTTTGGHTSRDHVEIVYSVSGSSVSTIGGNSYSGSAPSPSTIYTRYVAKHNPQNTSRIVYVVRPKYKGGTTVSHTIDGSYNREFTAYLKNPGNNHYVFDANHNSTGGYVNGIDPVTIHEVYTDGCCKFTYILDSGAYRTAYGQISWFSWDTTTRKSVLISWISERGPGYTIESNFPSTDSGTTQKVYYAWYAMLDENTAELYNSYRPGKSYSVTISVKYSDGTNVCDPYTYTNSSDNNWLGFTPQKADTITITVTLSGDINAETSTDFYVDYSAGLSKSKSSVNLDIKGTNTTTISFTPTGGYPGSRGISKSVNTDIVSIDSSGWSNGVYSITLTGKKNGTTNLVVDLYENYTGNKNVVATATVKITVTGQSFKLSYDANGGTGAPSSHTGITLTVKSTVPTRTGYKFLGWNTSSSHISPEYVGGDSITLTEATTLYAVWSRSGKAPYWGDVNEDNYIDYHDVTLVSQFMAGTKTPTAAQACFGDVNLDGKISIADMTKIAEYNSGSISAFPCESVVDITVVPAKTQYTKGEALKTSGTIIQVKKQNSTVSYELTDNISISGYNPNTVGTQTLTATYRGLKLTFTVTVIAPTVTKIAVKTMPTKTQYYIGESFAQSGLTLTATYSDGSTKTISSGFTCTGFSSSTAGTKTITVSYTEGSVSKTTTFTVTVIAPTVTKIAVKTMPTKTQYYIGESFAQSGLTLTATYSDGSTKTISSGFTCTGFSSSTAGTKTITVSYTEGSVSKTTTFTVTVIAPTVTKIAVKTMPTKTQYYIGESFAQSGLTLTATYSDGSTKTISSGFTCTGLSSSTTGSKTITVTYEGKTTTFTVSVVAATLSKIAVKNMPTKTTYYVGDSFNQSGLTLTATYSDGSTQTITSGFSCTGFSSTTTGTKTITVTYEGKTTSFTVTVIPAPVTLTSVSVKTKPTKTTYTLGESFDQSGLTLTATYSDGSTKTISSGFTCSGFSSSSAGTKTITVTYEGKTTSFTVSVNPATVILTSIAVKTLPTKTTYTVGEPFDQSGLTLTATYSDGSTKTVSSGFTCAGYSSTTAGAKTITVTYQGKTTSFAVTVTEKSPDPIIRIHNYVSSKTVDYRTKITFAVDPIQNPVSGAQVYWFIDGQLEPNSASETYTTREATKDFTVQAKYMMNGVVLAESEIETVNVKAGFFARLKAFFRALFGRLPKVTQEYLGIEFIDRVLPD